MNLDQITGILRAIVPAMVAYAVARGWISQSSAADVGAAILTLGAAAWSIYTNTLASKIVSVKADPEVARVIPSTLATPSTIEAAK